MSAPSSTFAAPTQPDLEKYAHPALQLSGQASPAGNSASESPVSSKIETDAAPQRTISGWRWFLVCLGTFSANLLYGLDTTIAADIQAAVSDTFDNVTQVGWLGVGFTLGSVTGILPLGKAYGMFDTKWVFVSSLTMFAAASALCGAAPNMNAMIIGRVWAGVGGAGMYLGTLNLVSTTTTPRERAFYVGFIGFVYGGGCILGPVVGGLFSDSSATWRWSFYLNLVVFAVMSPIYLFVLPSLPQQTERKSLAKAKSMDWLGITLSTGMYVCFVVAFSFGGTIWSWSDARFIVLAVLFILFALAFILSQYFVVLTNEPNRLFPGTLLRNPQLVLLYIAMSCGGAALFVTVYYIPFYYLFVHSESGTNAAVRLIPFICVYVASILACGYVLPRVGYAIVWYLVSGIFLVAGGAAMYTIERDSSNGHIYGFSVLVALGLTISQASYDVAANLVNPEQIPEAIQFLNLSQGAAQLLGLAIASSIFQSEAFRGMKDLLGPLGYTDGEIRGAVAGSRSEFLQSLDAGLNIKALDVIVGVIKKEWILVIVAGAVQTIVALFMTRRRAL